MHPYSRNKEEYREYNTNKDAVKREYPHHNITFRRGNVYVNGTFACKNDRSEDKIKTAIADTIDGAA